MGTNPAKQQLFSELSQISNAMSSAVRLTMLELLTHGGCSVEELARQMGISVANASQHLQKLRQARLLTVERHGKQRIYQLAHSKVCQLMETLIDLGVTQSAEAQNRLASIKGYNKDIEAIDLPALQDKIKHGAVTVVDVRSEAEFREGHIPGAKSVPLENLPSRIHELPADREIVAYCRGSLCTLSDEAVGILQKQGYLAKNFAKGMPEWQASGLNTEQASSSQHF
jgi:rhodanese-related sulfurtransferase/predicted transcriptional regulator